MPAQSSPAQHPLAEFAPKLVELTNGVLFGDVWERPGITPDGPTP